jgi:hypothetical protein
VQDAHDIPGYPPGVQVVIALAMTVALLLWVRVVRGLSERVS